MSSSFFSHRWNLVAALVVLAVYVMVLSVLPTNVFWAPDEGGRFIELHALRWDHGVVYTLPYPGRRLDPQLQFYPGSGDPNATYSVYPAPHPDGTLRFHWPIWFPLLSRAFLTAFGTTGLYVLPLLSGWLIALVAGRLTWFFLPAWAPIAILLVGFATPVCFYSQAFWEHTLATLLGTIAALLLVGARPGRLSTLAGMGPALLLAVVLRLEMLAFAVAVLLAWAVCAVVAHRHRAAVGPMTESPPRALPLRLLAVVVAALALALIAATALTPRHRGLLQSVPHRVSGHLAKVRHLPHGIIGLWINSPWNEGPWLDHRGEIAGLIALGLCLGATFVTTVSVEAALIVPGLLLLLVVSVALAGSTQQYRALHGVFPISPYLVIGLYALPQAWRRRDHRLLALAWLTSLYLLMGTGANFIVYANANGDLLNSLEWGPRYLLTLYPLLAVLSVVALHQHYTSERPAALRLSVVALIMMLVVVAGQQEVRGLGMLSTNRHIFTRWEAQLRQEGPIVTDLWWLPTAVADLFTTHEMYFVRERTQVRRWAALAAQQGVTRFTFASMEPVSADDFAAPAVRAATTGARTVFGLHLTRFQLAAVPDAQ